MYYVCIITIQIGNLKTMNIMINYIAIQNVVMDVQGVPRLIADVDFELQTNY